MPPAYNQPAYEAYSRQPQQPQQQHPPQHPEKRAMTGANQFHLPTRASGGAAGRGAASAAGGRFAVVEAPSASHALSNRIVLCEADWAGTPYVAIKGQYLYSTM